MRACLALIAAAAVAACSSGSPGTSSTSAGATGTASGGLPTTTGGLSSTTSGTGSGGATSTGGGSTTGGPLCQTTWPPRDCLAIAVCECADGTQQDFGCIGPPTCPDACCGHGGPLSDAGLTDAGVCQTMWPPRGCQAESLCTCADGTDEEFGCFGPPTCSEACCGHEGPGAVDAGATDAGLCQDWPPLPCDAIFLCHCANGMTEVAGCSGPPTCADACCADDGVAGPDGGASDGGLCRTDWPPRACLAEALCECDDGTTQEFGCIGPPTCGDACCGHGGPGDGGVAPPNDAGTGSPDAGKDAGSFTPPDDGGSTEIPGDAGLTVDGGVCPYYPPLACGAIIQCTCGDGTTALAACAGPPTCNDACCGHDGSSQP